MAAAQRHPPRSARLAVTSRVQAGRKGSLVSRVLLLEADGVLARDLDRGGGGVGIRGEAERGKGVVDGLHSSVRYSCCLSESRRAGKREEEGEEKRRRGQATRQGRGGHEAHSERARSGVPHFFSPLPFLSHVHHTAGCPSRRRGQSALCGDSWPWRNVVPPNIHPCACVQRLSSSLLCSSASSSALLARPCLRCPCACRVSAPPRFSPTRASSFETQCRPQAPHSRRTTVTSTGRSETLSSTLPTNCKAPPSPSVRDDRPFSDLTAFPGG